MNMIMQLLMCLMLCVPWCYVSAQTDNRQFNRPLPSLSLKERQTFWEGKRIFNAQWLPPDTASEFAAQGNHFNANACAECHVNAARGRPPHEGKPVFAVGLALSAHVTGYGDELNYNALPASDIEARVVLLYEERAGTLPDGSHYSLRKPTLIFQHLGYGGLPKDVAVSLRLAPHLAGAGFIESISDEQIAGYSDPDDKDRDGISGKVAWVADVIEGKRRAGRYGWKATAATLEQQIKNALRSDMGIQSCVQPQCPGRVNAVQIKALVSYARALSPPPSNIAANSQGSRTFKEVGCADCHIPGYSTSSLQGSPIKPDIRFSPYSDFLLHDMGEGLADRNAAGKAISREWKTTPLWGIAADTAMHGKIFYLHDGRARSVREAILWHDGEAIMAREKYLTLTKVLREALDRFVESI